MATNLRTTLKEVAEEVLEQWLDLGLILGAGWVVMPAMRLRRWCMNVLSLTSWHPSSMQARTVCILQCHCLLLPSCLFSLLLRMHLYMRSFLALETSCSLALKARIKSFSWSWQRAQHPHLPAKSDQSLEDLCRIGLDALQPGDDLKPSFRKGPDIRLVCSDSATSSRGSDASMHVANGFHPLTLTSRIYARGHTRITASSNPRVRVTFG